MQDSAPSSPVSVRGYVVTAGEGSLAGDGGCGEVAGVAGQCQVPWVVHTASTGAGVQALHSVHDVQHVHVHGVVPPAGAGQLPASVEHQTWGHCYKTSAESPGHGDPVPGV